MAWTSPFTAVSNTTLTAAQWNTAVRDNLNETAPAKATGPARFFVSNGANQIVERLINQGYISANETTSSTTYTDLTTFGPSIDMETGTNAVLWATAQGRNNTGGGHSQIGHVVSGATTISSPPAGALGESTNSQDDVVLSYVWMHESDLNSGTNTFTLKYRAASSGGAAGFHSRRILVMAM